LSLSVPVLTSTPDALDRLEERELVERAKREPEAFGELYRRHQLDVYRFAYSRLRNEADAEDVTSEVFMRALVAIGRYQDRGYAFTSWLLQIAANVVVDQHRARRPIEDIDEHPELAAEGSLEDLVAAGDQVRRIGRAARELPVRQREAFALRLGHDLKVDDVALRMGKSPGAVKLLVHRAVRGVRAAMPADPAALELAS
jgi:RNA polymerase sigma-70 factor (ECF subfamily)